MLWQPPQDRVAKTRLYHFIRQLDKTFPLADFSYATLYQFSIEQPKAFWQYLLQYFGLKYYGELEPINLEDSVNNHHWFPNASLNFAENLLLYGEDYKIAIKSLLENGSKKEIRYGELKSLVARLQANLKPVITQGDVVACYMPNIPESVITMLATTGLGGVFTSSSADANTDEVVDRFSLSKPKILVACAGYEYNGNYIDTLDKVSEIVTRLASLEKVIIVDYFDKRPNISNIQRAELWQEAIQENAAELHFVPRKFSDPLYIMYSSDTKGEPKCVVHGVGGVLTQHVKELGLHTDHSPEKNLFFCAKNGSMMWNWLISGLFFGGTITLYEGSLSYPSMEAFLKKLATQKINILGISPEYLQALADNKINMQEMDFTALETLFCTGAPLQPKYIDYVYQNIKSDILLTSLSGHPHITGHFFLGNPMAPASHSELQSCGLGVSTTCVNKDSDEASPKEEVIGKQCFPSSPIYFPETQLSKEARSGAIDHCEEAWPQRGFVELQGKNGAMLLDRDNKL